MPIDRAAALRKAEKLLRQGKLEAAIAEYARVVEDQPGDWNTANLLGDLYGRAGRADKAVEQFIRIADHLNEEGFLPKAAALYKKILKLKPEHEHALVQAAEIAASQGLLADARAYLGSVAERRRSSGDARGAAQIRIRLGTLDANDFEARANAARARAEIGDTAGALRDLKEIAATLSERGREADAIEVLREAALLSPDDEALREQLFQVYLRTGDLPRARQCATSKPQFEAVAARLEADGRHDEALDVLREVARLDPSDLAIRSHLGRAFVARGNLEAAAEYLTSETAGDDPELRLTVAEFHIRAGRLDEGLTLLRTLLEEDPHRREHIASAGWAIAESNPDAGFQIVELAADNAVLQGDWAGAAAALQEFVTRVPNHVAALMRLVEICVDGSLEATMFSAQAQLADAYLTAGHALEARVIAEDLVAREPWERANIDRFRHALVMLGESDPDGVIADRLSGQSPFVSTELSLAELSHSEPPPPEPTTIPPPENASPTADAHASGPPKAAKKRESRKRTESTVAPSERHFELGPNAIDLQSLMTELGRPTTAQSETSGASAEVDLSLALDEIRRGDTASTRPVEAASHEPKNLDEVFDQLRAGESGGSSADAGEERYRRGLVLRDAGQLDQAVDELRAAARSPRVRFGASSVLGRLYRERGQIPQAIEWLERAAQVPAASADEGHQLLYELEELLEASGETARALAICLELRADAGDYRDVSSRIERLTKVQTRG